MEKSYSSINNKCILSTIAFFIACIILITYTTTYTKNFSIVISVTNSDHSDPHSPEVPQLSPPPATSNNSDLHSPEVPQLLPPPATSNDSNLHSSEIPQLSPPPATSNNSDLHSPEPQPQLSPPPPVSPPPAASREINKTEKCNILDGKWVYSPESSPIYQVWQCPFLSDQVSCRKNGRSDFAYQFWSWEATAEGCKIPRFNATDMLERLRGKRVIIAGDSLNRNQWESLACLLYSSVPADRTFVNVESGGYKIFKAKDYDCTVEFFWAPFLVELEKNPEPGKTVLRLDKVTSVSRKWRGADIMVFNTGHWWVHRGKMRAWDFLAYNGTRVDEMSVESALEMALKTWTKWIKREVNTKKTRIFFRSISPEHKGNNECLNKTEPIKDESYEPRFPASILKTVEKMVGAAPVTYLNITKLSQYRVEGHPSLHLKKRPDVLILNEDCSHWCLPGVPDTWNRLLYADMVQANSGTSHSVP